MFNIKEALTSIFKEKGWGYKFAIPLLLQLMVVIPGIVLQASAPPVQAAYLNSYKLAASSYDWTTLLLSCITLLALIPYIIVTMWYMYENTQAAIFDRATKPIWHASFKDSIKKIGKYGLVDLAYSMIALLAFIVFCLVFGIIIFGLSLLATGSLANYASQDSLILLFTTGLGSLLICCFGVIFLIAYVMFYMWMTTGSLRLIATNSFAEGLKLDDNWQIAMRHKGKFGVLLLLILLYSVVSGVLSGGVGIVSAFLAPNFPLVNLIVQVGFNVGLAVFTTYATYFVYTRLLGQMFRQIVKEEKSLHYIKV